MDVSADVGFRERPSRFLLLVVLLIGQAWLTLRLFTHEYTLEPLRNNEPIVSGRHGLHYYHGLLGATAWSERGTHCSYDPAYQAGYPKTPLFDPGSRSAEFFLLVGGSSPATYKIGLALVCLFVPIGFVLTARGIGLRPATACLAGLLGMVLFWSPPSRAMLEEGDTDIFLGGLFLMIHAAWLIRFDRRPGLDSWLIMTASAVAAWYTQPLLVIAWWPWLFVYYLWIAYRQGMIWHVAMLLALALAIGVNFGRMRDWLRYAWMYLPFGGEIPSSFPSFSASLEQRWQHLLPTDPIYIGIGVGGLVGLLVMLSTHRGGAWIFGLGATMFALLGASGRLWPSLREFGTERFVLCAAWCLAIPCAVVLGRIAEHFGKASEVPLLGPVWLLTALTVPVWLIGLPQHCVNLPKMELGLNPQRTEIVERLRQSTTTEARILWEDRTTSSTHLGWTALLAERTERSFLGGLDPTGRVEYMYARLCDGRLAGKPVATWSDTELDRFAQQYNLGWIVCWTAESIERFRHYGRAREAATLHDGESGVLFILDRKPSYFLKGKGEWLEASDRRIALVNVTPENGEVLLSLHYQERWRVSPSYVQVEPAVDPDDPRPFVRLRHSGPIHRLTLVWENP